MIKSLHPDFIYPGIHTRTHVHKYTHELGEEPKENGPKSVVKFCMSQKPRICYHSIFSLSLCIFRAQIAMFCVQMLRSSEPAGAG